MAMEYSRAHPAKWAWCHIRGMAFAFFNPEVRTIATHLGIARRDNSVNGGAEMARRSPWWLRAASRGDC